MGFIRAAIDSSKDHPNGVTVVAGHIGNTEAWAAIDEPWNARLVLEGLGKFHLTDIKRRFGEARWLGVVNPFSIIIGRSELQCISASLRDSDWAKLNHDRGYLKQYPNKELACLDMLWDVLHDARSLDFANEQVTVVFDNDWGNRDVIVKNHDAWSNRTGRPGFNIFLKGGVPWDGVPLQAADMAAGLIRLDPFSRAWLDNKSPVGLFDELVRVASRAMGKRSRGSVWSKALAQSVEEAIHRRTSSAIA